MEAVEAVQVALVIPVMPSLNTPSVFCILYFRGRRCVLLDGIGTPNSRWFLRSYLIYNIRSPRIRSVDRVGLVGRFIVQSVAKIDRNLWD